MLLTVSTVKDTLPALHRFVDRNLACGVDHLVMYVDDGDQALTAALAEHPHVTAVPTGPRWWHGKRPRRLNVRQRVNANVTRALLATQPWAQWLFHIDADEVLRVDRAALAGLPARVGAVRAETWEAVSRPTWPEDRVTHFKRKLDDDRLRELHGLGLIQVPDNGAYFSGHLDGKSGIRPVMHRWLGLHSAADVTGRRVAGRSGVAQVLHYESWSGAEFARKWTNILGSGEVVRLRPGREPLAAALRAIVHGGLEGPARGAALDELFARTTADDFDALLALGVLVEVDPDAGGHQPETLGAERSAVLEVLLDAVRPENKWSFETGATAPGMLRVLARTADRLDTEGQPELAARARETWVLPDEVLAVLAGVAPVPGAAAADAPQGRA